MNTQIIIVKPKTLSAQDKAKLTKAGNIVIEHEKPHEINYHETEEKLPYLYTSCAACGERIYLLKERLSALQKNGWPFFCSHGHENKYSK